MHWLSHGLSCKRSLHHDFSCGNHDLRAHPNTAVGSVNGRRYKFHIQGGPEKTGPFLKVHNSFI